MRLVALATAVFITNPLGAQHAPPRDDPGVHRIVAAVSAERIAADVATLVGFGTRSTLSDTLSPMRGIGAARRWIKAEFERIGAACGGCLEVLYVSEVFPAGGRLPQATNVVNVLARQRGTTDPDRVVIMSGDIDSRISRNDNAIDSAPGANDNASGMAGTLEAARVLSQHRFAGSVVYLGLSGEEQGLYGGGTVARYARERGWRIEAMLNNDMIGNIEGISGVIDNTRARVFSDGTPPVDVALAALAGDGLREAARDSGTIEVSAVDLARLVGQLRTRRRTGGEVDGISRQLARYVDRIAEMYIPNLDVMMIYRLDRFGRGGHHTPFANLGYPAVRIMEANENYTRQHQDIRVEDGIAYGDVLEGVDFAYAAKLTALNAATLAALAWAPGAPRNVRIRGAVRPSATLSWEPSTDALRGSGYRVYWRATDSPTWDHSRWVGDVTEHRFEGLIIDNYFFGVAAVSANGHESVIAFPG